MSIESLAELDATTVEEFQLSEAVLANAVRLRLRDGRQLYLEFADANYKLPVGFTESTLFTLMVETPEGTDIDAMPFGGYPVVVEHTGWPLIGRDRMANTNEGILRTGDMVTLFSPVPNVYTELAHLTIDGIDLLVA
jgi:hypothetical protein